MRSILLNIIDSLTIFFESGESQNFLFIPKIISLTLSIILFAFFVVLVLRLRTSIGQSFKIFSQSIGAPDLPKKKMTKKWEEITKKIATGDENAFKLSVIEADKFFDDILVRIGYKGKDMGERLKQITPAQMSSINDIWRAHKTRNSIVHDPDFKTTRSQADEAVKAYERALKELQVL